MTAVAAPTTSPTASPASSTGMSDTTGATGTSAMLSLAAAAALVPGSRCIGDGSIVFGRVHSDTRTVRDGDLFVALRGDRFDAHAFLPQAYAAGAVGALAECGLSAAQPGLQVPDALAGLQQLAAAWRARFTLPLLAVTGSNGKTTVTQMVASVLRAWLGADAMLATAGNFNNHIGVPLTLLRLRTEHRAAVLELGMNHPGEIATLAAMAAPSVVLVNNAQREHQEFMATVEAVAHENGSAIGALPDSGCVVLPAADAHAALWRRLAGGRRVCSFAFDGPADVVADGVAWHGDRWTLALQAPTGRAHTVLRMPGRHNVVNALAAAAGALALGAPLSAVARGLADFDAVAGRSQVQRLSWRGRDVTLVDDSYNANPDSVLAAIDVLAHLPGPGWLVLGDMAEVGAEGPAFHAEAGRRARDAGIDTVWAAGSLGRHVGATRCFSDAAALVEALHEAPPAASILVKGSRSLGMERVVAAIRAAAAAAREGSA